MTEEWKSIKGYEGLYEVSNLGRVRTLDRYITDKNGVEKFCKGKIMKQYLESGYKRITLNKDGKKTKIYVHRLVAEAFIPNPECKPQIDHIDTNKENNKVNNLRWVTSKENMNNPITLERHLDNLKELHNRINLNDVHEKNKIKVLCVTTGNVFDSIKEAAEYYKCSKAHITAVCKGKRNTCGKLSDGTRLKWKYLK